MKRKQKQRVETEKGAVKIIYNSLYSMKKSYSKKKKMGYVKKKKKKKVTSTSMAPFRVPVHFEHRRTWKKTVGVPCHFETLG